MQAADILIVGGGAAGSIAAIFAARALREAGSAGRVVILETRRQPGAKIRVSGGGRCNVLPQASALIDFETRGSPNTLRNVAMSWPLHEVRAFFEQELGLPLVDEDRGKVFPKSGDSRDVVSALQGGLRRAGVELVCQARVQSIAHAPHKTRPFTLTLSDGALWLASHVVIATGGLSMPRTGSDGHGLAMLRRLGHDIVTCAPSLVALEAQPPHFAALSGLSVEAKLTARRGPKIVGEATGPLLFTHRGYSGPVALDISRHVTLPLAIGAQGTAALTLSASWGEGATQARCPMTWWHDALAQGAPLAIATVLRRSLPRRLVDALLHEADIPDEQPTAALRRPQRERLLGLLVAAPLGVCGSEGYRTAECTTGGVALDNVVAKTLESRRCANLHLCGEVLDVTGRLGGFNFLWAWSSGRRAGHSAARAYLAARDATEPPDHAPLAATA